MSSMRAGMRARHGGPSGNAVGMMQRHGVNVRKTTRRAVVVRAGCGIVALVLPGNAAALGEAERHFIAEAARMKREAEASGDQPFGAVVVKDGSIIGYGPSRVIVDRNPDAHAERVALWDAQRRLGMNDMTGARDLFDFPALRRMPGCPCARECRTHVLRCRWRRRGKAAALPVGAPCNASDW